MATSKSDETRQLLIQEASDPDTDPERLRQLAEGYYGVTGAVLRNPSVPEDTWRKGLLNRWIEAWDNPMAPIYLIAWTPRQDDWQTLEGAAMLATCSLFEDPAQQCSTQGKVLIAAKVHEWWETTEDARGMMLLLGRWAYAKGRESPEHRNVVRILVVCLRTFTRFTTKDNEALDLLEAWAEGGEDRIDEAEELCDSYIVQDAVYFSQGISYDAWALLNELLKVLTLEKEGSEAEKAMAQHKRKLANLLRREMPLPPVAE